MDPTVVAAIVYGLFAIVTSILTLFLKQYIDNRTKLRIPAGRRRAITGHWEGMAHQEPGPNGQPIDFAVTVELTAGRKTISGRLTIRFELDGKREQARFNVTGGFFHGYFLQLNYTPRDEATIQFGSVILELDAAGKRLKGRFAGYGKITQTVVSGTAELEKVA